MSRIVSRMSFRLLGGASVVAAVAAFGMDLGGGSISRVARHVFDSYFIAFFDAVNFGTLCF